MEHKNSNDRDGGGGYHCTYTSGILETTALHEVFLYLLYQTVGNSVLIKPQIVTLKEVIYFTKAWRHECPEFP